MGRKKSAKKRSHVNRKQQVSLTPDKGTTVQRTYKDSLFRFIFKDKQKLLKLYNALNGTDHRDIDSLSVTTIENVLYIGYKNDVSFLLDNTLNLYEHQGSWNPNMPLRGVLYFARLLQDYTEASQFNLYGSKRIPLGAVQAALGLCRIYPLYPQQPFGWIFRAGCGRPCRRALSEGRYSYGRIEGAS